MGWTKTFSVPPVQNQGQVVEWCHHFQCNTPLALLGVNFVYLFLWKANILIARLGHP